MPALSVMQSAAAAAVCDLWRYTSDGLFDYSAVTRDQQIPGSSLTHCAVEYGYGEAAHERVCLTPRSKIWYSGERAVILRSREGNRIGVASQVTEPL